MSAHRDEFEKTGVPLGESAAFIIGRHLDHPHLERDIATLAGLLDHLDGTKAQLRGALAYLAAQVWRETRTSDNRRLTDAETVISQTRKALAWWDEAEARRTTREDTTDGH